MIALPIEADPALRTAVSYVRVSTNAQAVRGPSRDGFSIPAQREANRRYAQSLGAVIVAEFIERGASARSARRPELQRLLAYVEERRIDFVIVHKVDRFARNREDDALLTAQLRRHGSRLVSTTEAISDTPDGRLVHGIMAAIAEFYSQNLSLEVSKGMRQKVLQGGTVGRAPIGYLNARAYDHEGREYPTVVLDPERAEHITWAFATYATGTISLAQLADALTRRGLNPRTIAGREPTILTARAVRKILTNPYYRGIVRFNELEVVGEHPPLTDSVTWANVQDMINTRRNGTRSRVHDHYLKGTVRCYACGRQLVVHHARSKNGRVYDYFICVGKAAPNRCHQGAVPISNAEERIEELWARLPEDDRLSARAHEVAATWPQRAVDELVARKAHAHGEIDQISARQERLPVLIDDGVIPADIAAAKTEDFTLQLERLRDELQAIEEQLADSAARLTNLAAANPASLYRDADEPLRQRLNQAVFAEIRIGRSPDELTYQLF